MIISELVGYNEQDDLYRKIELENGVRHYHFMHSMIGAALISGRLRLPPFMPRHTSPFRSTHEPNSLGRQVPICS